ncbi:MAG: carboxylesterase family protein [Bacteroidales bacterium]|nr:carboxylesterase family protein [Bacteroidales bacterium]
MKAVFVSIITAALLATGCFENKNPEGPVIRTKNGLILGEYNTQSGIYVFRGIPYASPPVGEFRWKPPQPLQNWHDTLNCTRFSACAIQETPVPFSMWTSEFIAPSAPLSEDCLYLNIWAPNKNTTEKCPVIVYIHGGGFNAGSGSVPVYDGTQMAGKGIVFVTINYRLGIFGFLAHPGLTAESDNNSSGNYGLLDQIAALKWVKENIHAFGGDSTNITIAGQSAGAYSVCCLTASPLAGGLFHKAITQSGGAVLPTGRFSHTATLDTAEKIGQATAASLQIKTIDGLRNIPADELLQAKGNFGPIVDGYVLPDIIYNTYFKGKQNDVPLLAGWNANEGLYFFEVKNATGFKEKSREIYGSHANDFLRFFPADNDSVARLSQFSHADMLSFGVQAYKWTTMQAKTGKSPVYLYYFSRRVPYGNEQADYGAFHSSEIFYAFNNLGISKNRPWQKVDYALANTMSGYWANFAKTGNPNGKGLPDWLPCKTEALNAMFLGDTVKITPVPEIEKLRFLESFYESAFYVN